MAGSTVVERNLDRITVIVALVFMFTTVLLSMRLRLTARPWGLPTIAEFPWTGQGFGRGMTRQIKSADVSSSNPSRR